jgi:hypothetical protein
LQVTLPLILLYLLPYLLTCSYWFCGNWESVIWNSRKYSVFGTTHFFLYLIWLLLYCIWFIWPHYNKDRPYYHPNIKHLNSFQQPNQNKSLFTRLDRLHG